MINVDKIKGRMKEKGFTQKTLSVEMELDISTLNKKINNRDGKYLTVEEAQNMTDILEIENPSEYFFCSRVADKQIPIRATQIENRNK